MQVQIHAACVSTVAGRDMAGGAAVSKARTVSDDLSRARAHLRSCRNALEEMESELPVLVRMANEWRAALDGGNKLLFAGNGGSFAHAAHFAAELAGRFLRERPALAALCLGCNGPAFSAIANDYGQESVFARELEALGHAGDCFVALSTSGNSANLIRAVEVARCMGLKTHAFTGLSGGLLRPMVDLCLPVPSDHTPIIQELHQSAMHVLCELVESRPCPRRQEGADRTGNPSSA